MMQMKLDMPILSTHESLMRMMRKSSELRRYHLAREQQEMAECTSFKDTLQTLIKSAPSVD